MMVHHRPSRLWSCLGVVAIFAVAAGRGEAFLAAAATMSSGDRHRQTTSSSPSLSPLFTIPDLQDFCIDTEPDGDGGDEDLVEQSRQHDRKKKRLSSLRVEQYHLLWSPGSWKKFMIGTGTLFLAHAIGELFVLAGLVNSALSSSASVRTHGVAPLLTLLATNFVIPMLASACCFLQLAMNVFAVGCAGFNTVLGPIRPYFISLLFYLTLISRDSRHGLTKHWALVTTLRWAIALLPECLHLWNNRHRFFADRMAKRFSTEPAIATSGNFWAEVQLDIPTMGCVACINSIDKALGRTDGVQFAASSLNPFGEKGGRAEVRIAAESREEVDAIIQSLTDAVENAGFAKSSVKSVRIQQDLLSYAVGRADT